MNKKLLYLLILSITQYVQPQSIFNKFITNSKSSIKSVKDYCYKNPKVFLGIVTVKTVGTTVPFYVAFKYSAQKAEAEKATQLQIAENQKQDIILEKLRQRNIGLQSSIATIAMLGTLWAIDKYKDKIANWLQLTNIKSPHEPNSFNEILLRIKTVPEAIQELKKHGFTKVEIIRNQQCIQLKTPYFSPQQVQEIINAL